MGRREQKERERKRAAASCQTLDSFLPAAKRSRPSSTSAEDNRDNLPPAERPDDDSTITEGTSNVVTVTERQGRIEVAYRDSEDINSSVNDSDVNNSAVIDSSTVTVAQPQGCSVSSFSNETMHFDIGGIVACCPTEDDVIDEVHALSTAQKYRLLTQHDKPDKKYVFSTGFTGGCNQSFLPGWLDQHKWLSYSKKLDGAFCVPCALFNGACTKPIKGKLVTAPFRTWQKKSEKFKAHESLHCHSESLMFATDLRRTVEHPEESISDKIDS